ncbi:hypothetical protein ACI6Q2_19365 [Chitinophagaceae bacterium LWZ2-11]
MSDTHQDLNETKLQTTLIIVVMCAVLGAIAYLVSTGAIHY